MNLLSLKGNTKLGHTVATTTLPIAQTCPTTCMHHPSNEATCYAYQGPMRWHQDRMSREGLTPAAIVSLEVDAIKSVPPDTLTRLHVAGEWVNARHVKAVAKVVKARALKAWTYTHRWRTLKQESFKGINVLASCESLAEVYVSWAKGYAPALVVPKFQSPKAYALPSISFIHRAFIGIPCPAQLKDTITCADCKLCLKTDWLHATRRVILFEAHGTRARKLAEKLIQIS